ncbi:MAG: glutathione synthase [Proteobacteria bacterium]|nr:glutathione synthase [Pseudomonadota bacterium]MCL2308561.1 glutathione synthase [Pseudomonadota bacterium]
MNLLFILDPLAKLKAHKDSSVAMMRALQRRGHGLYACEIGELFAVGNETGSEAAAMAFAVARKIIVSDDNTRWRREDSPAKMPLTAFDVVMMRKDPPFDMEYVVATYVLEIAERAGVAVFNKPQRIRDFNEKAAILRFPQFITPTLVSRQPEVLQAFIDEHCDTILKPLDGMGGTSVFRVRADDPNRNVIIEVLNDFGARSVMAQRFIPAISEGDKRVLIIGGKVVPFAVARIPKAGETRGNLAAGGKALVMPLTERETDIAEALASPLWEQGLLIVGLDIIGGFLTEVNVTSPTCFVNIAEQANFDVANLVADRLEEIIQ